MNQEKKIIEAIEKLISIDSELRQTERRLELLNKQKPIQNAEVERILRLLGETNAKNGVIYEGFLYHIGNDNQLKIQPLPATILARR